MQGKDLRHSLHLTVVVIEKGVLHLDYGQPTYIYIYIYK